MIPQLKASMYQKIIIFILLVVLKNLDFILKRILIYAFLSNMKKKDIIYQIIKQVFFQNVMIIAFHVVMAQ